MSTQDEMTFGHVMHTQASGQPDGLPGHMSRPVQVTVIGAGSNFCPVLVQDILSIPNNAGGRFHLVDIDAHRLSVMHELVERLIEQANHQGLGRAWSVSSSTDRRELLPHSDYVVCCIEVSGEDCVQWDNDIPLRYGIDQCIGDTLGPGGLFKGLRTVPVFIEILRDMESLCPDALMLNYTNPMSMLVLAGGRAVPLVKAVGLCHSVQGTSHLLAEYAGVPYEDMQWECAGINHLAWFTRLEHQGQDLYESRLIEQFKTDIAKGLEEASQGLATHDNTQLHDPPIEPAYEQEDLVRKDICIHFGAFITESSGHLSEYLPYYRKSEAGRALLRLGYHGGSRFYATHWPTWRREADARRQRWLTGDEPLPSERSWEYASWIIEAIEKDAPFRIHGNVMNNPPSLTDSGTSALISNLPSDGAVEVACRVDGDGVQPMVFGALPSQMAHLCASNMAFFDLAAKACIERFRESAIHALMLDPLTSAVLTPSEIRNMANEMFEAERDYLPEYV